MNRSVPVTIPPSILVLIASESLLITSCFLLASYWISPEYELYLLYDSGLQQIVTTTAVIQLGLYFQLMYDTQISSRLLLIQQLSLIIGSAFILQSVLMVAGIMAMPLWIMMYGSLLVFFAVPAWRILFSRLAKVSTSRKVLFLGTSSSVRTIADYLQRRPDRGLEALGYLGNEPVPPLAPLGTLQNVETVLSTVRPDRIVTAYRHSGPLLPTRLLLDLQIAGTQVEDASELHETLLGRINGMDLSPEDLLFDTVDTARNVHSLLATLTGLLGLLLTSPLFLLIPLLLKISSPSSPVFERGTYVGQFGKPFSLWRFHSRLDTRIGRWLRRSGLAKLPYLLNLLLGDLALIGPKPERQEFAAVLQREIPFYSYRHQIKPGLTGWSQLLTSRSLMRPALEHLEYDLYYIRRCSASFDAYILLHSLLPGKQL